MAASNAVRLAGMMFLQYGGLGAWSVPLARWLDQAPALGGLGFSPSEIAGIYCTLALGGIIAPLFTGILADRTFASEKLIGALNIIMGVLMIAAGIWCRDHAGANADSSIAFWPLFAILLAYAMAIMIAITTGAAMTLRDLDDPTRQFGRVRLVGTLGWIVSVAIIGGVLKPLSADQFWVAAVCHGLLAVGSRWLPHTPPLGKGRPLAEVIGLPAMTLFRNPSFIVFVIVAFTANMMLAFYTIFANACCGKLGMHRPELVMTSSQFVEMACMASIPFAVSLLGLKRTMVLGLSAWALRNAIFSSESVPWIAWLGIPLQGLAYTYFTIVGSLYIDREAPPNLRAGAQSLMTFLSNGPGQLCGNLLSGGVVALNTHGLSVNWQGVWLVPMVGCTIAAAAFALLFREPRAGGMTIAEFHAELADNAEVIQREDVVGS